VLKQNCVTFCYDSPLLWYIAIADTTTFSLIPFMPLVPFEALSIVLFVLGMGVHLAVMRPSLAFFASPKQPPVTSTSSSYGPPTGSDDHDDGVVDELKLLAAQDTDIGRRRTIEWLVGGDDVCNFDWAAAGRVFSVIVLVVHVTFWVAAFVECWVRKVRLRNSVVDPRVSRRYRWGL